ncbi:response regulator transcription factor [Gracilibacillus alcaliphilus]|uniref:response regulator transcription factor n=1 Tax=Gracilibacillus alcaliphilus TaxID=1401441 RepID=UPI00195D2699|nr:response regulator [Gracilibacillus alcaliphilus]MBM7678190.1 two-component system response regulator YesN [Gracilibacillus alcaliphilus]
MYRILIVDDEKDERNVIRFLLNKYQFPFDIMEADNGKSALELLEGESIDVLITDVKMPFVDGMELAARVRALSSHVEIVFFSGHDDFTYVKKALTLRADNYILKPVKPGEFKETIEKVLEHIKVYEQELEEKEANKDFMKKHILYQVLNQTPIEVLEKDYAYVDFSFLDDYNRMILIHSDQSFWDTLSEEENIRLDEKISKVISNSRYDLINLNPSQVILLFKDDCNRLIAYRQLASDIWQQLHQVYRIGCFFSVSEEIKTGEDILSIYNKLDRYLDDRFFHPHTYIYPVDSPTVASHELGAEDEQLIQDIEQSIQQMEEDKLTEAVQRLIQKYEQQGSTSHIYLRFLFSRVLQLLSKIVPEYSDGKINKEIEKVYTLPHFEDVQQLIWQVHHKAAQKIKEEKNSSKDNIRVVQQYIADHISEDLSLDILAEKAFLSPGYLSDKFRQETGYGINKYIKNVRMTKTKELLRDTNRKVNDISKAVGYNSVSYFIKNFREHYGMSPKKYREMNQDKG